MNNCITKAEDIQPFEKYISKGWMTPFPLPCGQKFPPKNGFTGDIETVSEEVTREEWDREMGDFNLGLRMDITGEYDVISLDVDQYKDKHGKDNLVELMNELGELPLKATPRSTRRGIDSPAAQYFFLVPKGLKWASKVCADVDVVQKNHRFSAVWPSTVDGDMYRWYLGDEEAGIPNVKDLPKLPVAWVNYLQRGNLVKRHAPAEYFGTEEADEWLSKVAPGYEDAPSAGFLTGLEPKLEAMVGNAHDTLNDSIWWAICYAITDGQPGLEDVIEALKAKFLIEAERADNATAEREYTRTYLHGVNKIRGEIEAGKRSLFVAKAVPVSMESLTSLAGATEAAEALEETVKAIEFLMRDEQGDNLPASVLKMCNDSMIVVRGRDLRGNEVSRLYDTVTGRFVDVPTLMSMCEDIAPILKHMRSIGEAIQFTAAKDDESAQSYAQWLMAGTNSLLYYFSVRRSVDGMQAPLRGKLVKDGRVREESEFDTDPWVLLLSDGLLLDLHKANKPGAFLAECVRPRNRKDLLTPDRKMGVSGADIECYAGTSHEIADLYEIVFPDPAVRKQVYRAQAYSLLGENTHRLLWGLIGEPGTGKGTSTTAYTGVLGSYASSVTLSALTDTGGNNTKMAAALKSRVATMSEFSPETKGDVATLKAISGNDTIQVADKYKAAEEMRSGTTLFFETNHAPNLEADKAFRDRLVVVPMEGDRPALEEWLSEHGGWSRNKANLVGHLEVLIEHFHDAALHGFKDTDLPAKMVEAADKFVADGDPLSEWIEDNFVFGPDFRLLSNTLMFEIRAAIVRGDLPKEMTAPKVRKRLEQNGAVYSGSNKFTVDGTRGRGLTGVRIGPALGLVPAPEAVEDKSA